MSTSVPVLPPGATLVLDVVDEAYEAQLVAAVDSRPWDAESGLRRNTQQYGYRYDYARRALDTTDRPAPAVPDTFAARHVLGRMWALLQHVPEDFNQIIINDYHTGQGIRGHTDADCFGDTIVVLSLAGEAVMHFKSRGKHCTPVTLPRRSALILQGPARHTWSHEIAERRQVQGRRVSITWRHVPSTGE